MGVRRAYRTPETTTFVDIVQCRPHTSDMAHPAALVPLKRVRRRKRVAENSPGTENPQPPTENAQSDGGAHEDR